MFIEFTGERKGNTHSIKSIEKMIEDKKCSFKNFNDDGIEVKFESGLKVWLSSASWNLSRFKKKVKEQKKFSLPSRWKGIKYAQVLIHDVPTQRPVYQYKKTKIFNLRELGEDLPSLPVFYFRDGETLGLAEAFYGTTILSANEGAVRDKKNKIHQTINNLLREHSKKLLSEKFTSLILQRSRRESYHSVIKTTTIEALSE